MRINFIVDEKSSSLLLFEQLRQKEINEVEAFFSLWK